MAKSLFDHLNAITDKKDPKYWDKLEDADKKTWSNYMILRFLSMKPEWIETIADIQPYIQNAPPKAMYLALIELIPKTRAFLKYMEPASAEKYEKWVVELVSQYYEVSQLEAEGYLEILYETTNGKLHIKEIAQAYGTDPKEITKLKLKV
jgi:wyosine [tRNA(Phe)-imidazoG37] synthetase (radical SAM superfamily)